MKSNIKRIFIVSIVLIIVFIISIMFVNTRYKENNNREDKIQFYENVIEERGLIVEIYNTGELTEEILTNRNGKIIIEKAIGVVINSNKDGIIINNKYNGYLGSYVSYRSVEDTESGDVVLTYFVYNPTNNYVDDILERFDYIIDDSNS